MKVLHISPSFAPAWSYGGAIGAILELCLALARARCEVRVLTTDANGPERLRLSASDRNVELAPDLRVEYCARALGESISPHLLYKLYSLVGWADVIHLHGVYSFPTLPTLLACRLLDKPLVWSPHGSLQRWRGTRKKTTKRLWEKICRAISPDRVLLYSTSEEEAAESVARIAGTSAVVIGNGVTVPQSLRPREPQTGDLRLLFLGRLDQKKGVESLIDACAMLAARQFAFSLVIAGDGEQSYVDGLQERVRQTGLTQRARFAGFVPHDAIGVLFEQAAVVVVPSHTENFAMVVVEALGHGVPVIASRGTPWERIEVMGCGLWVPNDPASLADAIIRISRMPLNEMGEKARRWMEAEYSWDEKARQTLVCYGLVARSLTRRSFGSAGQALARDLRNWPIPPG